MEKKKGLRRLPNKGIGGEQGGEEEARGEMNEEISDVSKS